MCESARLRGLVSAPASHIFALRRDQLGEAAYAAVLAAARVSLHARNGTFSTQIDRADAQASATEATVSSSVFPTERAWLRTPLVRPPKRQVAQGDDLEFWNGFGGFIRDGREYVVRLGPGEATPQPWINVVANDSLGFHVSSEGAAFTWSANSRDHHLTPWSNDPVTNRPGEALFVVDRATGQVFTPFAALSFDGEARFEARHGAGFSSFTCEYGELSLEAWLTEDPIDPVRLTKLRVTNRSRTARKLRVYSYLEWVLGGNREQTAPFVASTYDARSGMVTACNPYAVEYAGRTAFFCCDAAHSSATADRAAFLGTGSV
jgi:cyclic beta-1,2-glucan synthetase